MFTTSHKTKVEQFSPFIHSYYIMRSEISSFLQKSPKRLTLGYVMYLPTPYTNIIPEILSDFQARTLKEKSYKTISKSIRYSKKISRAMFFTKNSQKIYIDIFSSFWYFSFSLIYFYLEKYFRCINKDVISCELV